jgi:hypothetical protein
MNTNRNIMYIFTLATSAAGGCLGPNPLLKECGQSWIVVAQDAQGEYSNGSSEAIQENGQWMSASACYNGVQSENVLDPASLEYMALRTAALAACQEKAVELGFVTDNCEESLTEPTELGTCLLHKAECSGPGDTGETGETGEPEVGFDNPTRFISCKGSKCVVQQAFIDQVLQASADTFAADGTTLAPHISATGIQDGWEFGGVTKGNLGGALGFENGDVVTEVGGEPFDSWNAILEAGNAALRARVVGIVFIRDNRVLTRSYSRI